MKEQWATEMGKLRTPFNELVSDKDEAKKMVKKALFNAVDELAASVQGVAFSGGVDSCFLLLHGRVKNQGIVPITVGLPNAADVQEAKEFVEKFTFEGVCEVVTPEDVEKLIAEVTRVVPVIDVVSVGVGSVTLQVCKVAKRLGFSAVFTGLGSEEIFAGYQRHRDAATQGWEALHEECWRGLLGLYERDMSRDVPLAKSQGVALITPYLHPEVVRAAMAVHPMLKLNDDHTKVILREIAEENGVEPRWAWRKKKAAQYGSGFHKVLQKIAKRQKKSIDELLRK